MSCDLTLESADITPDASFRSRDAVYSKTSFIRHYDQCKSALSLWDISNNGSIESPILPEFCKLGCHFGIRI